MLLNEDLSNFLNYSYFNEQLNSNHKIDFNLYLNKLKVNFYIKNKEKNRFIFKYSKNNME